MTSTWRTKSRRTIDAVVSDNPDATAEELKKLLFDAYPFGTRSHFPYKVWSEEVAKVLRKPTPKDVITFWVKP